MQYLHIISAHPPTYFILIPKQCLHIIAFMWIRYSTQWTGISRFVLWSFIKLFPLHYFLSRWLESVDVEPLHMSSQLYIIPPCPLPPNPKRSNFIFLEQLCQAGLAFQHSHKVKAPAQELTRLEDMPNPQVTSNPSISANVGQCHPQHGHKAFIIPTSHSLGRLMPAWPGFRLHPLCRDLYTQHHQAQRAGVKVR